jgi:hypothetical protein
VQIFHNAVRYPLQYNESIEGKGPPQRKDLNKPEPPVDTKLAFKALADGMERAKLLKDGKHPWTTQSGPRGYVSKIDGSVQPYILSVPAAYKPGQVGPLPLALSCHGRNEHLTELAFVSSKVGEGAPATRPSATRTRSSSSTCTAGTAARTSWPARSTCSRRGTP